MSLSSGSWEQIKQDMEHVSQFRSLNEHDWNALCNAIEAELVKNRQKQVSRHNVFAYERRREDRRQAERRSYDRLEDISDHDWSQLCDKIYERSMTQQINNQRTGEDRRQDERRSG
jgi:hypothetical protein